MKRLLCIFLLVFGSFGFSFGAKLWFSAEKNVLVENCPAKIDVMLDTEGAMTTAMDLRVIFTPQEMLLNDFDGEGSLFRSYTVPIFPIISDSSIFTGQKVMYSLLSTLSRWGIQGKGKVGTLVLTPVAGSQSVSLQFYMMPYLDENDSNVIVISGGKTYDALGTSDSLLLPVVAGDCSLEEKQLGEQQISLTGGAIVVVENTQFRSQFAFQELKDRVSAWMVLNSKTMILLLLILLLFVGGISFYKYRKYKL